MPQIGQINTDYLLIFNLFISAHLFNLRHLRAIV